MPTLKQDPLFHGPDEPCLLHYPQFDGMVGRGTVIVCPGSNYEFLSPLEGLPVVEWLASHGIGAVVLRYRLLPHYDLDDALDDLEAAAARVRQMRAGPVAALGFSAGGHLIASLGLRAHERGQPQPLDAQILVYPGIDGRDWDHPDYNGFFSHGKWRIPKRAALLHRGQEALLGGEGFAAPPTCLVGSTEDTCTPNEQHTDIYAEALGDHNIPYLYLRDAFGEHGFELKGGWTTGAAKWLLSSNFGGAPQQPGTHVMTLRRPAARLPMEDCSPSDSSTAAAALAAEEPMPEPLPTPAESHLFELPMDRPPPLRTLSSGETLMETLTVETLVKEGANKAVRVDSCFACTPAPQGSSHTFGEGPMLMPNTALTQSLTQSSTMSVSDQGSSLDCFGASSKPFVRPVPKFNSFKNKKGDMDGPPSVGAMKKAAHKATGSEENENAAFAAFAHTSHTQGPFPADTTMHSGVNSFGSLFNELPSTSRPGAAVDPVIEV